MGKPQRRALKARYLFPVAQAPIPGGILTIEGERIVAVGRAAARADTEDLGNVAILPGLVNAHTHLVFSALAEPLGSAGIAMPDWIRTVLAWQSQVPVPPNEAIQRGLEECSRCGTTSLGEIAPPDWPQEPFEQSPLHTTVFQELIGPTRFRAALAQDLAKTHLDRHASDRWSHGLSPHAPYTVRLDLLEAVVESSSRHKLPLAFHLAESREELELLRRQTGPFYDFLCGLENWEPATIPRGSRPLDYLQRLAGAHRVLVIHGNYLSDDEMAFLAKHRKNMSVVYCPRSHRFFRHADYPLTRMLAHGVHLCLGTDSRASAPDLSVLAELRELASRHPAMDAQQLLEMATIAGARALGRDRHVGTLECGKHADLAVVGLPDREASDAHDLLLRSDEPVIGTWFHGRPA